MKALVISTHPDDETLGCGGTILKHLADGDSLFWLIVTEAHEPRWNEETTERMSTQVKRVAEAYGMEKCFKLGFPTVMLDTVPQDDLITKIREVVAEVKPDLVYVVHSGDVHSDHRAVFTTTMSVLKPIYMEQLGVRRVLSYECLSSTEAAAPNAETAFIPNVFSDITPYLDRKIEIMQMYETEIQPEPLPRGPSAIRGLARYRGATIGVEYAEAFSLIRELT